MKEKILKLYENSELSKQVQDKLKFLRPVFDQLDSETLSHESYINQSVEKVCFFFVHRADVRTNVKFILDKYEIAILINNLGVYYYFDEANKKSLEVIKTTSIQVLMGKYKLINYFDGKGEIVKLELEFDNTELGKQKYMSLWNLLRIRFIKLRKETYYGLNLTLN